MALGPFRVGRVSVLGFAVGLRVRGFSCLGFKC